jgi:hypothetical protein
MGTIEKIRIDRVDPSITNWKSKNFQERINFIKYWAKIINSQKDEEWSEGQKILIDGQFDHANNFYEDLKKTEEGKIIFERVKRERLKLDK